MPLLYLLGAAAAAAGSQAAPQCHPAFPSCSLSTHPAPASPIIPQACRMGESLPWSLALFRCLEWWWVVIPCTGILLQEKHRFSLFPFFFL